MLVLSRKQGERIVIGSDVTITIVAVHGDRVKLGFEAPGEVVIHRQEIHDRIQKEAQQRAQPLTPIRCEIPSRLVATVSP